MLFRYAFVWLITYLIKCFSYWYQVLFMWKSTYYYTGYIRPVLRDMTRAVAASLTQTLMDFTNSVFIETSKSKIYKLQRVQNCLARVVLQNHLNSSISFLSKLHWLPIPKRIDFKITTLTKAVEFGQPTHLSSMLIPYRIGRCLRSVICTTRQ